MVISALFKIVFCGTEFVSCFCYGFLMKRFLCLCAEEIENRLSAVTTEKIGGNNGLLKTGRKILNNSNVPLFQNKPCFLFAK